MTRKSLDVVIARYNEDLSWVFKLPDHALIWPYNKGTDINMGTPLPNLGRESHTYLHHILAFYHKLSNTEADYIAFLQGNPFDHCPDVIEQITAEVYVGLDFYPLGKFRPTCDLTGAPHHAGLDLKGFADNVLKFQLPEQLTFTAGAQFVIHKRVLQKYSIDFYWTLFANSVIHHQMPYMLERTWERIFTNDTAEVRKDVDGNVA